MTKSLRLNCWKIISNCDNEEKVKEYKITKELCNKLLPFKKLITDLISFKDTKSLYETVEELLKFIKIEKKNHKKNKLIYYQKK